MRSFIILFAYSCFCLVNGRLIDQLVPCPINDGDCQRDLYQKALKYVAKGDPELNIPPIDPLDVKNVSISVLNMVDIEFVHGIVKGVKDCVFEKISTSIEKFHSTMEIRCSITIKGHYRAKATGPLVKSILGNQDIYADGNAKIKMDNMRIKFEVDFHASRNADGDILLQCTNPNKTFSEYTFEIGDKAYFNLDNVYLGKQDISPLVMTILNENWRPIMQTFGKVFTDKAMEITYSYIHKFFDYVPAKVYISDDLEQYVDGEKLQ